MKILFTKDMTFTKFLVNGVMKGWAMHVTLKWKV